MPVSSKKREVPENRPCLGRLHSNRPSPSLSQRQLASQCRLSSLCLPFITAVYPDQRAKLSEICLIHDHGPSGESLSGIPTPLQCTFEAQEPNGTREELCMLLPTNVSSSTPVAPCYPRMLDESKDKQVRCADAITSSK